MKKIFIGIILICALYAFFTLVSIFTKHSPAPANITTSPTLFPTPTSFVVKQPQVNPQNSDNKLIDAIQNRQTLSATDSASKNSIIRSLNDQPGSPAKTDEFRIDYLPAGDLFQVEILTTDYQKAKTDATNWFLTNGFTQEGICKLPVEFYLNWNIRTQLNLTNFNPLPDGC